MFLIFYLLNHCKKYMRVSLERRVLAALIDRFVVFCIFIITSLVIFGPYDAPTLMGYSFHQMGQTPMYSSNPIYNGNIYQNLYLSFILIYFSVNVVYFLFLEIFFKRSIGKKILSIKYVSVNDGRPTILQFILKNISFFFLVFCNIFYNI